MQVDAQHLEDLLNGARAAATRKNLHAQRLATFQLLDYYTAILRQAGSTVGRDVSELGIGDLVSIVLAYVPGLSGLEYLRKLRKIRNDLSHDEEYAPPAKDLQLFLDRAQEVRAVLEKGAQDAARRIASLDPLGREFLRTAEGIRRHLPTLSDEAKPDWTASADQALTLSKVAPDAYRADDILLLLTWSRQVSHWDGWDSAMNSEVYEPDHDPYEADVSGEPNYDPRDFEPDYDPGDFYEDPGEPPEPNDDPGEPPEPNED